MRMRAGELPIMRLACVGVPPTMTQLERGGSGAQGTGEQGAPCACVVQRGRGGEERAEGLVVKMGLQRLQPGWS